MRAELSLSVVDVFLALPDAADEAAVVGADVTADVAADVATVYVAKQTSGWVLAAMILISEHSL